jgi:VanZ family protein
LLLLAVVADAYYPFDVTLEVSAVWHNLKNSRLIPFTGGLRRFWLDLFLEKVLLFAAIGYLALRNLSDSSVLNQRLAWAACSTIAALIEVGKLFFAGRAPNVDNVVFSSLGALGGVTIIAPLAATSFARKHAEKILGLSLLCIIAYVELSPFDWIRSAHEIRSRVAMIEWLPFRSYYSAEPQAALFDLAKKMFLLGALGFLVAQGNRDGTPRKRQVLATTVGLLLGLILEASQIGLWSRNPSLTDVFLFGAAAWAGAVVFERYRRIRDAQV